MRGAGLLLKQAGRKFVRNLLWMLALSGALGAILVFATHLPLLEAAIFVGIYAPALAAIVTVVALWSGAHDETLRSAPNDPGPRPDGSGSGGWHGGPWDGDGGGGVDNKAAANGPTLTLIHPTT
jgi:uncharacterized membrane protein YgcG